MKLSILIQPLIIVGLSVWLFFCYRGCGHKSDISPTGSNDSLQYWKDKDGNNVASIKKKDEDFAKAIFDLDSMAMLLNTKPKFIKEYIQVISKTTDTIYSANDPVVIYQNDSIRTMSQMFESPYHIAEVTIDRLGDSSRLLLSSVDTIDAVQKLVREGNIFNRRWYVQYDIKNRNPNTVITQINAYKQALPKPKKIGIGFHVGYGFSTGLKPKPYVGVGISYNFLRL